VQQNFLFYRAVLVLLSAACSASSAMGAAPDAESSKLPLHVTTYAPSKLSLPVGAYRVPESSYVILRQDFKGGLASTLFGPLGVLAVDSSIKKKGEAASKASLSAFDLDLDVETRNVLKSMLQGDEQLLEMRGKDVDAIDIAPGVWIGTYKDGTSRLHVVVEARIGKKGKRKKWQGRYIYYSTETLPLMGDNGWMANDGALIKSATKEGINVAVGVLLQDFRGSLDHDGKKSRYKAKYMAFPEAVALEGIMLAENDEVAIVESLAGWVGVNIFAAREVSLFQD
jgi:hypothetical protein